MCVCNKFKWITSCCLQEKKTHVNLSLELTLDVQQVFAETAGFDLDWRECADYWERLIPKVIYRKCMCHYKYRSGTTKDWVNVYTEPTAAAAQHSHGWRAEPLPIWPRPWIACVHGEGCTLPRLCAFANVGFECLKVDKLKSLQSVMH